MWASETVNLLLPDPRRHRSAHEIHRELQRTPNAAARAAQREERSVLRVRATLRPGVSAGIRVVHCLQPNGNISTLAHEPKAGERPALLLQIRAQ